jgi:hypothetical protein
LIILVGFFKGYLPLKIGDVIAEPQQMYVRIALSVTDTDEDFIEKYLDLSSQKKVQQHL